MNPQAPRRVANPSPGALHDHNRECHNVEERKKRATIESVGVQDSSPWESATVAKFYSAILPSSVDEKLRRSCGAGRLRAEGGAEMRQVEQQGVDQNRMHKHVPARKLVTI